MSSTNCSGTTRNTHANKMNQSPDLITFRKINSKWIIVLNVKCKTIKLLENNRRKYRGPWVWWCPFRHNTKIIIMKKDPWKKLLISIKDFIKMENFCLAKDNVKRMSGHRLRKIFLQSTSEKELLSKTHKEHLKIRKQTIKLTNGPILKDSSPKKIHRWQISTCKEQWAIS